MHKIKQRLAAFTFLEYTFPLFLLLAAVLCYGWVIPWLGFYWDDWAFVYISQRLGTDGLARYFATNRPVWGLLYRLTTTLVGEVPWRWQVFGLAWHWLSAVALWGMVRLLWPRQRDAAAWISLLYLVYPGFDQQPIAITYGHFFIVLTAFFLSFGCTLLALRRPRWAVGFTVLALLLSAMNLLMMEYFFLLELVRPLVLWVALGDNIPDGRKRLRPALLRAAPYLALFVAAALWRVLFFRYQTQNYEPVLLNQLRGQPLAAVLGLAGTVLRDLWLTTFGAWAHAFRFPNPAVLGARTAELTTGVFLVSLLLMGVYLVKYRPTAKVPTGSDPAARGSLVGGSAQAPVWALPAMGLGLGGLLVAGWPFWLTHLPVSLVYPNSRFTLSFVLGSSFLMAGLLRLLPRSWMRLGLLVAALSAAAGMHFQDANSFRRDWNLQKTLMWQMSWRAPGLEPNTALLFGDMDFNYCSDNTLTAPLNWVYAPDNHGETLSYVLYYPTVRVGRALPALQPGLPIEQNYLAAWFSGNTSNTVAMVFNPPACVRVLDAVEAQNPMLTEQMREAAGLSNLARIQLPSPQPAARPPAQIFGAEPAHGWCYYFEKADLARQAGDWAQVVTLGDQAFQLKDYPNDPAERLPFIEGYAHVGSWQRALELTNESSAITPLIRPTLCRLWQRIDTQTSPSAEKDTALRQARTDLSCQP